MSSLKAGRPFAAGPRPFARLADRRSLSRGRQV